MTLTNVSQNAYLAKYLRKPTYYNLVIVISAASSHLSISHMYLTAILSADGLFDSSIDIKKALNQIVGQSYLKNVNGFSSKATIERKLFLYLFF
jgi:hypothetical protein